MSTVLPFPENPLATEELFGHLVDIVAEGIYVVDRDRRITFWNAAAEKITGYRASDVVGRRCADGILRHCDAAGEFLCGTGCPLVATMDDGKEREVNVFLNHHDGRRVPVAVRSSVVKNRWGAVIGCAELFSDASHMNAMVEELHCAREHARIDALTGLGNRRLVEEKLRSFGGSRRFGKGAVGILFFDIDRFKRVNDTYGHQVGDEVIVAVAKTATGMLRSFDTIGRWGGEEFVVIAPEINLADLTEVANRLRSVIGAMRVPVADGDLEITVSIGATLIRTSESGEEALERADGLMYQSKRKGRDRVTAG